MAIEIIGNQPVSIVLGSDFNTINEDCTQANIPFCQMVRPGDTTMFQMLQSQETGNNLVLNQPFDGVLTGWQGASWAFAPGLGATTIHTSTLSTVPDITVEPNKTYQIKYDVTLSVDSKVTILFIASGNVDIWGEQASAIGEVRTYTAFVRFDSATSVTVGFTSNVDSGGILSIDNIEMLELTEPTVELHDSNDNNVLSITDLAYFENFIQATFDWPDIAEGKYNICVTGIDDLSTNFLFDSLCLGTNNGGELLQENGECIKWLG